MPLLALAVSCGSKPEQKEKLLLGGSGWNDIAIVDKESGVIEWSYHIDDEPLECNSLEITSDNDKIFLAYRHGVRLIDRQTQKVLWDYPIAEGEEAQSAKIYGDTTFVAAVCGTPARIIEFDLNGNIKKELKIDTQIEDHHMQFRQVTKTSNGNYIVPMFARGIICEVSPTGEIVRTIDGKGMTFSVKEIEGGKWIFTTGDSHSFITVDLATGERKESAHDKLLAFAAEPHVYEDGSVIVCSWVGHSETKDEPKIVHFDAQGNEIWRMANQKEGIGMVSAMDIFYE